MVIVIVRNVDMRNVFRAWFGGFCLLPFIFYFFNPFDLYLAIQNLYLLAFIYLACAKSCFIIIVVLKHFLTLISFPNPVLMFKHCLHVYQMK